MFDRVMLQPGDNPKALSSYGLKIKRKEFFTQPCIALNGTKCTMYQHRPTRCRLFECQQYKQVAEATLPEASALERIAQVKQQVIAFEALLNELASNNPRKSLTQRYANALLELPEPSALRNDLRLAYDQIQAALTEHFRVA